MPTGPLETEFFGQRLRPPHEAPRPVSPTPRKAALCDRLNLGGPISLVLALLFVWVATPAAARSDRARNVLVLYSYQAGLPANIEMDQAIRAVLRSGPAGRIELFSEEIDVGRFPGKRYEWGLDDFMRRKYGSRSIDVIITTFPPALEFVLRHRTNLFPGVPVVFSAVEADELKRYDPDHSITGVTIKGDVIRNTLDIALGLHPDTKEVIYVGGTTPFEQVWEAKVRQLSRAYAGRVSFRYLSDLSMDQILQEVSNLPASSIVFHFMIAQDKTGKSFVPQYALALVSEASSVPVYGVSDTNLGHGIVGGQGIDYEAQGTKAAETALRILGGEKVENIPIVGDVPNVTMFDWRHVRRWGIPEDRLPPGSVIRFREPSAWERYRWYIVGGVTLCLVEALLIVGLLVHRRMRRRAEQSLVERLAFEELLANLSAAFVNLPADEIDGEIERGLRRIVERLGLDRTSLSEFTADAKSFRFVYSWTVEGLEPLPSALSIESFPWVADRLRRGGTIRFSRLQELPNDAVIDRQSYSSLGIKSQVAIPLTAGGSVVGSIAFSTLRGERSWPDDLVPRLQLVGEIFANALMRKRADTVIRESEERFRIMADSAPVLIWMSGLRKEGVFFNRPWLQFTGKSLQQEFGEGWMESIHPDDHGALEACESAFSNREPFQTQFRLRRADGEYRWMLDTGVPRFTPDGTFAGYIGSCIDVTERKLTEEALRESESRYRHIVEDQTELICRFLPDGTLTFVNETYCRYFGGRSKDLVGRSFWSLIPEQDQERGKQHLASISLERPVATVEHRAVMPDGEIRWQHWTDRGIFDEHGTLLGFQSVGRDITELKQAELALRESEQRFRQMADAAPVMVWLAGLDKGCTYFNKRWLDFTGHTLAQELGDGWADGVHPDDMERCIGIYSRAFDARQPFEMEYRLRRFDGEYRWIIDIGVPLLEKDGRFSGYIGSCIDITERKQAEERLRISEAVSGGILASLAGQMAIIDRTGVIVRVNEAWARFSLENGAPPSACVSVGANYLDACRRAIQGGDETVPAALAGIEAVLDGVWEEFVLEYPCHSPTQEQWYLMRVTPLKRADGGAVISHINITQRRLGQLEVERLRQELTHVTRVTTMGELTASLAHELNQPLTAIVSNAQAGERFLAAGSPPMGEVREILEDIVADGRRAGEVIHRMRAMLRKRSFEFAPVDLNEIIREVVILTHSDAVIRDTRVSLELDPDFPPVRGDRIQLQQVLLNLILNGLEAMGAVAPTDRRLVVRTKRGEDRTVRVEVRDAGVGIKEEKMDRIFEPFYTTKPSGMGMGLSISRSIVEAHGGRIGAGNNPDRGATLWFTLPAIVDSAPTS